MWSAIYQTKDRVSLSLSLYYYRISAWQCRYEILEVQQVVHFHKICHFVKSHEISVEEGYFRAHWIDSHDSMTIERANSIVALFTILVPYSLLLNVVIYFNTVVWLQDLYNLMTTTFVAPFSHCDQKLTFSCFFFILYNIF